MTWHLNTCVNLYLLERIKVIQSKIIVGICVTSQVIQWLKLHSFYMAWLPQIRETHIVCNLVCYFTSLTDPNKFAIYDIFGGENLG